MLVHLAGSSVDITNEYLYYRKIAEVINKQGSIITRDWINSAYEENIKAKEGITPFNVRNDWTEIQAENHKGVSRADVVIVEASTYGFHPGYFTSLALTHKKPTLLLSRGEVKSPILGIKDPNLFVKVYHTEEDLEKIVTKFLKDNTISSKDLRFNFFIDRQIYSFLREVSYETGKNKSEIIRELLEKEIDHQDEKR